MNRITKTVVGLGLFLCGLIGIFRAEPVSATTIDLDVVPTTFHVKLDPGESTVDSFTVKNDSDVDLDYTIKAVPYYATGSEAGGLDVFYDRESTHTMIKDWVKFDKTSGNLKRGDSVTVSFTVTVPSDAPGGGQYVALLFSTGESKAPSDGASVSEVAQLGPVLYATISGDIREEGEILSNSVGGLYFNPPITASSRVKNNGNVHATAEYTMKVFSIFGGESLYNNEDDPAVVTVLPDSERYYNLTWDESPSLGIYRVESTVRIYDEVSTIEQVVIICPVWVLFLIIAFIFAVVFWLVSRAKQRKENK